eukprot:9843453-Alexandrium_andersonii.AAC.1
MFAQSLGRLCAATRNWPKRCVVLGAEGSQWPFMKGVGHGALSGQVNIIGRALISHGVPVLHGREMWRGLDIANDGMRLKW